MYNRTVEEGEMTYGDEMDRLFYCTVAARIPPQAAYCHFSVSCRRVGDMRIALSIASTIWCLSSTWHWQS